MTHLSMCLLLLPALLLSGCLDGPQAPRPQPDAAHAEALSAQPPAAPDLPREQEVVCENRTLYTYHQNGTWTDRQTAETFDVPPGTNNLTVAGRVGWQATAEYRVTIEDPNGTPWYNAYMVGYQVHEYGLDAWGGYREGRWGGDAQADPPTGAHTFKIHHVGPVADLQYVITGTVCTTV